MKRGNRRMRKGRGGVLRGGEVAGWGELSDRPVMLSPSKYDDYQWDITLRRAQGDTTRGSWLPQ
jgi:hypothetical protein